MGNRLTFNNAGEMALYLYAIRHYSIEESIIDWADDDTDWGSGYDYNNSYSWTRAPELNELVVQDGVLTGFSAGGKVLEINGIHEINQERSSRRYGSGHIWHLIIDEEPDYPHFFAVILKREEIDSQESRSELYSRYVRKYVSGTNIEDERGFADGNVRCRFELTEYAAEHPIETINWLRTFFPNKVTMLKK